MLTAFSVFLTVFASNTAAHELRPSVADLTVADGQVELVMRLNIEAFLADVDLDGLEDTDDSDNAEKYDALRALTGAEIAGQVSALLEDWNALPLVAIDGSAVSLTSQSIVVPDDIAFEFARETTWTLVGDVAPRASTVQVNWPEAAGALLLRQEGVEDGYLGYLNGGDQSPEISVSGGGYQGGWGAFLNYIPVGFDHILPHGLDHILFVLGLFLLSTKLGPLLWQVSAFTLAHTVTLALGALGLVNIPGSIVEPLIAASIVYVAIENIFFTGLSKSRPVIVFLFGLLHGLGFASVLGDFGLPQGHFVPALIGFNVGVELGQLAVIAMAAVVIFFAVELARLAPLDGLEEEVRDYDVMFRACSITGSLIIGIIGAWWVVERTLL